MKSFLSIILFFINSVLFSQTYSVLFKADMRIKTNKVEFKPAIDTLYLMGNFNGWQAKDKMADDDKDTVYACTLSNLNTDSLLVFKFFYPESNWEFCEDRVIKIPDHDLIYKDFFDKDSIVIKTDFWNE